MPEHYQTRGMAQTHPRLKRRMPGLLVPPARQPLDVLQHEDLRLPVANVPEDAPHGPPAPVRSARQRVTGDCAPARLACACPQHASGPGGWLVRQAAVEPSRGEGLAGKAGDVEVDRRSVDVFRPANIVVQRDVWVVVLEQPTDDWILLGHEGVRDRQPMRFRAMTSVAMPVRPEPTTMGDLATSLLKRTPFAPSMAPLTQREVRQQNSGLTALARLTVGLGRGLATGLWRRATRLSGFRLPLAMALGPAT